MAAQPDAVLDRHHAAFHADLRALGDGDLRLDQVDAGDLLGHGVLDLDARVDLDEVEGAGVGVHQELDRSGVGVIDRAAQLQRGFAQRVAGGGIEVRGRGALDHLLVAPLHGAVTLVQVQQVAVGIAQQLDLDMARALHQLLEVDLIVAKGRQRLAARDRHLGQQLLLVGDDAHAAPAPTPAGLEHDGIADLGGGGQRLI